MSHTQSLSTKSPQPSRRGRSTNRFLQQPQEQPMTGTHPAVAGWLPLSPRHVRRTGPDGAHALSHSLLMVTLREGTVRGFMGTLKKAFLRRECLIPRCSSEQVLAMWKVKAEIMVSGEAGSWECLGWRRNPRGEAGLGDECGDDSCVPVSQGPCCGLPAVRGL